MNRFEVPAPVASVVMILGRGYEYREGSYYPSAETAARAIEPVDYLSSIGSEAEEALYLFSGWYGKVAGRGHTPEPLAGVSEAVLGYKEFLDQLARTPGCSHLIDPSTHATSLRTALDPNSGDTFTNFTESIIARHVSPGMFSPQKPFALSAGRAHSWRGGVIATQALALEQGSLRRLNVTGEDSPTVSAREWVLLAMTRAALAEVGEGNGAEPGNLSHTEAAAVAFEEMTLMSKPLLARTLAHTSLWVPPHRSSRPLVLSKRLLVGCLI